MSRLKLQVIFKKRERLQKLYSRINDKKEFHTQCDAVLLSSMKKLEVKCDDAPCKQDVKFTRMATNTELVLPVACLKSKQS